MTDKDPSCEERIRENLDSTLERIRDMRERMSDFDLSDTEREEAFEEFNNYGLCFDYVEGDADREEDGFFRWQLSWGGPSDEFRFYVDADLDPYKVEYVFMDWFDGATRRLYGDDRDLLLEVFNEFKDCGCCNHAIEEHY